MTLNTLIIILFIAIFDGIAIYFFRKKLGDLKRSQANHHEFLLKVKNDIPILHQRVCELEDQILPPQDDKNDMH